MKQRCKLDLGRLSEYLVVDPTSPTGLRWKNKHWKMPAGSVAGGLKSTGHYSMNFFGRQLHCHRVVWALTHGQDPGPHTVDHIDRNPANNHPDNLRLASPSGQGYNTNDRPSKYGRNVHRVGNRFYARLLVNGKEVSLGGYPTPEEAAQVAAQAKSNYIKEHEHHIYPKA